MSSLFGGGAKTVPEFTGLQINTAVQALPVPMIYGAPRVSINLIYYNGFNVQMPGGGKGILSGGKGGGQPQYFATIALAIGEGVIPQVYIIYQDQGVYTPATYPTNGAFYFQGTATQPPAAYIVALWPADARPYKNTAYYLFANAQLDSSATVPQINIVPQGLFSGSSPLNNTSLVITQGQYDQNGNPVSFIGTLHLNTVDADPAQVIYDFLTNSRYGAGFPSSLIDTQSLFTSLDGFNSAIGDSALSTYCQAAGLAWSVVLNNPESANSVLERWTGNLVVAPVWNGAVLRFVPYWDRPVSTNPGYVATNPQNIAKKYFTPVTTPITNITVDQILDADQPEEDPITFARKDPMEVYNTVRVDFRDRENYFNDNAVEAKDEAHAELFGIRVDNIGSAQEFSLKEYANVCAQMKLRRNISVLRTFTFKLGPLWGWLEPMHIVNIPDPTNYAATLTVRIISIEDDEKEESTVTAEEFPLGAQSPSLIPVTSTTPPNQGATNALAQSVFQPVIFEPTTAMLTATGFGTPQVIVGASAGTFNTLDTNYGGCNIWVSLDDVNYEKIGTLFLPSTIGQLSTGLPAYGGANPDNVDTLQVNLSQSSGTLASASTLAASSGKTICAIQDASGFEILSYTTSTLVTGHTFNLTGLYRGLYGTTPRQFGLGSLFLYVNTNANFFETALPPQYVGNTFWIKLPTFNVFHNNTQDLSTVVAYQYTAVGPTPRGPTVPNSIQRGDIRRRGLLSTTPNPRSRRTLLLKP